MTEYEKISEDLQWRYATKLFDPTRGITEEDLESIKESILMTPTSYGLQPFQVRIVEDAETRELLRPVSWGQSQITDAAVLMVFCHSTAVGVQDVAAHLDRRALAYDLGRDTQVNAEKFMNATLAKMSPEYMHAWTSRQAYIALGFAMSTCARLRVDCCPIEGIEVADYDRILDLSKDSLSTCCALAIGHRSAEDDYASKPKFRKAMGEVVR